MRKIEHEGVLFAIVITPGDFKPGVHFVSSAEWPFQLGLLMHSAGHRVAAHLHLEHEGRIVNTAQEFLFVIRGRMEVDFYTLQGALFHTETVERGEALLHVKGGHGFRFIEQSQVLEVKQGPYLGRSKDKQLITDSTPV